MGMFSKDKEIGLSLTEEFAMGEEFILYGVAVHEQSVSTSLGMADKTVLTVSRLRNGGAGPRFECGTLGSAIASKAKEADADDFPCVVKWIKVPGRADSEATVLRWVRDVTVGKPAERSPSEPPPPQG